jgi:hypothetical protein
MSTDYMLIHLYVFVLASVAKTYCIDLVFPVLMK